MGNTKFAQNAQVVICQCCDKKAPIAKYCYAAIEKFQGPVANHTMAGSSHSSGWIMKSRAPHHVTIDLNYLSDGHVSAQARPKPK